MGLILVRSDLGDGGWSLHAPGTTDEQIAEGHGILLSGTANWDTGWDRPNEADYAAAEQSLAELNPLR